MKKRSLSKDAQLIFSFITNCKQLTQKDDEAMLKYLEKHRTLITIILIAILLAAFVFLPVHVQLSSTVILLIGIGMAIILIFEKHRRTYYQSESTREKMLRNFSLDVIGLLLALAAAILAGGRAGGWAGAQAGLWAGLLEGFVIGFLAAWIVRALWGRVVRALA